MEKEEIEGKSIGRRYSTSYPPLKKTTELELRMDNECKVFLTDKERKACRRGFKEGVNYSIEAIELVKRKGLKVLK